MKLSLLLVTVFFAVNSFAKTYRKPATYDTDSQTAAERAGKQLCEISFGEGCVVGKVVCKDTSIDETTATQSCQVAIKSVKGTKMPGTLSYRVEILNGRVNSVTEHCGMCD